RSRLRAAQALRKRDAVRHPAQAIAAGTAARARGRKAGVGGHPPVAPVAADLLGELGMQREAAPRQRFERRAVAPVKGEEAARFARGSAGDAGAFDHRRAHAAAGEKISDRGADDAAATDQHMHADTFSWSMIFSENRYPLFGIMLRLTPSAFARSERR